MSLSRFARQTNAVDFAYGINPQVPPVLVTNGPNASGSGTITMAFGYFITADGTEVTAPFNTNAPIIVGGGSLVETVTPSSVSNSTPRQFNTAQITATFTNLHGNGDQVRSGTCGLQEAINWLASVGGGTVVVDSSWVGLGGTTAMIQAASLQGVVLLDNRGGTVNSTGPFKSQVVLTNTQILQMFTTAVQLLPPPGTGYFYNILKATLVNENSGTAYAAGGAISIGYGTTPIQGLSGTIANTFLTSPTVTQVIQLAGVNLASTTEAQFDNVGIFINNASGAFTTGVGTLKCSIVYSVESK